MLLKEMFDLHGKTALVTGGAGYLGGVICETLVEQGASVTIASRDLKKCKDKAAEIKKKFPNAEVTAMQIDLSSENSIDNFISSLDKLDILVNNAASATPNPIAKTTIDEWVEDIDNTLNSVFRLTKKAMPLLSESKGTILNIASMYGHVSPDYRIYNKENYTSPAGYGAAKAGVIQLTKYLASFLAPDGIRVNCISPGSFPRPSIQKDVDFMKRLSEKNPLNRIGQPHELKGAVALLCSPASSYMTGQNICVDGGWSIW